MIKKEHEMKVMWRASIFFSVFVIAFVLKVREEEQIEEEKRVRHRQLEMEKTEREKVEKKEFERR